MSSQEIVIAIKGGGEMASAIAHRLFRSNLKNICMIGMEEPLSVRRPVSFCEAVYTGCATVEGVTASLANNSAELKNVWNQVRSGDFAGTQRKQR